MTYCLNTAADHGQAAKAQEDMLKFITEATSIPGNTDWCSLADLFTGAAQDGNKDVDAE